MNTEQKARAYDRAIKRAKDMLSYKEVRQEDMEYLFPELRESEDERIRNAICIYLDWLDGRKDYAPRGEFTIKDMLAWFEKQGQVKESSTLQHEGTQKDTSCKENADSLTREQKFKVENWYQCTKYFFGKGVTFDKNTAYYCAIEGCLQDEYGCHIAIVKDLYDNFKLWTIADAKDGDVLFAENFDNIGGCVFLFKGLDSWKFDAEGDRAIATGYCCTSITESGNTDFGIQGPDCVEIKRVHPATKEQRDLLFQKMKEAGYEWNAEKKELKKIDNEEYNGEDYGIDSLYHAQRILEKTLGKVDGYQSDDGILEHKCAITAIKKLYEQKPAEWSEKDKDNIQRALYYVDYYQTHEADTKEAEECFDWLKSLKPQNHWKPTEAQLASLRIACDRNDRVGFDLTQLLKELKEL